MSGWGINVSGNECAHHRAGIRPDMDCDSIHGGVLDGKKQRGLTAMPHLFQNVNVSVHVADQLPFLQYLADQDRGGLSRYIRGLIEADPAYQDWLRSRQMP